MKSLIKTLPIVVTAFLVLFIVPGKAEKVLRPNFKDISLWSDEQFVTHNIKMDNLDPHINLTLNVLQPLNQVDLHVEVSLVHKLNPNYFTTLNTTVNFCTILNYRQKSPVGNLVANYLKQYGHIMDKCPINKGKYFLHNFWIPEDSALSQFAELDFVILLKAFHVDANKQQTLIVNDNLSGELVVHDAKNVKTGILGLLPKVF